MLYKDGEKYFTQAPEVVNDLTTGGTTKALSAEQGKVLKQTIDNLPQGGHTIKNDAGTSLTQRDNLKFVGVYTSDDSTNNKTDVQIVREFQSVADIEALTGEEAKGFQYLDDDVYDAFTASDIGFDNSDTSFTGTDVQEVLEEVDYSLNGTVYTGDLNDLTKTGVYGHSVTANSNAPSDVPLTTILNIFVITTNLGITTQVAYFGNTRIYVRRKYNGSWNSWNNVVAGRFSTTVTRYGGYLNSSGNYTGYYPYNVVKCPVSQGMNFRAYNLSNNGDTYHRFLDITGATVGNLIKATTSVMEFTVPTNAVAVEFTMYSTDYAPIVTPI